ncbi:MAG: membrane-bound O-acyltransferase family protein [Bacteroidetes bacterium HGW-Bacteroidetes-12]|nr:MAG: membrane-bound O-acyltransferase family protein [Bacteroidetes bacterium HGW-Bacteroidetes-12]
MGIKLDASINNKHRKLLLILSLSFNLGLLGFFKYFNFFVDSFIDLFNLFGITLQHRTLSILLPVGISFYTFQTLSYTIDIYRKKITATKNALAFFSFVSFFPQLVAGPIERASELLPQFLKKRKFSYAFAVSGLRQILWGLFKKVVIADNIAQHVDIVYSSPENFYGLPVIIATILFTFQVYCDFSGYSDIAIGVAKLFGFKLMTNFNTPLFSKSMKELWNRWHISLSTWFRDYLYYPLGGNKVSKPKWALNIFITFFISGLWHGPSVAFVVWGSLNGIYLIIEALTQDFRIRFYKLIGFVKFPTILKATQIFFTFSLFAFSLIIFRAENGYDALTLIGRLPQQLITQVTSVDAIISTLTPMFSTQLELVYLLCSFALFISVDLLIRNKGIDGVLRTIPTFGRISIYYIIISWILFFGAFEKPQEFVYFQF